MSAKMAPQGIACLVKVRLWHELADCINIDGSYECVWKDGATGDGLSCEGKVKVQLKLKLKSHGQCIYLSFLSIWTSLKYVICNPS